MNTMVETVGAGSVEVESNATESTWNLTRLTRGRTK